MAAKNERHQAKLAGDKHYFTGKPCKHGHIAPRIISCAGCTICHAARNFSQNRTDKAKEYAAQHRKDNKEKISLYQKKWVKENYGKVLEKNAQRRAARVNRTLPWLNNGHKFEIECIHKYASSLRKIGLKYEVDHIVPLQGKLVSGLHTPWNMQVIGRFDNRSKGIKHYE